MAPVRLQNLRVQSGGLSPVESEPDLAEARVSPLFLVFSQTKQKLVQKQII